MFPHGLAANVRRAKSNAIGSSASVSVSAVSLLFAPVDPLLAHSSGTTMPTNWLPFHGENNASLVPLKQLFYPRPAKPVNPLFHYPSRSGSRLFVVRDFGAPDSRRNHCWQVVGFWKFPPKHRFAFAGGLLVYVTFNAVADLRVGMWTLSMPKLAFFLSPMILLLWTSALVHMPRGHRPRNGVHSCWRGLVSGSAGSWPTSLATKTPTN